MCIKQIPIWAQFLTQYQNILDPGISGYFRFNGRVKYAHFNKELSSHVGNVEQNQMKAKAMCQMEFSSKNLFDNLGSQKSFVDNSVLWPF